jgi:hypothetical protein
VGGRICPSTHLNSESNLLIHIMFIAAVGVSKAVEFWSASYVHEHKYSFISLEEYSCGLYEILYLCM